MPEKLNHPTGTYPILDHMREERLPLTREVYIALNWWDKNHQMTHEDEAELPPQFRR